jgi:hypothetical protein
VEENVVGGGLYARSTSEERGKKGQRAVLDRLPRLNGKLTSLPASYSQLPPSDPSLALGETPPPPPKAFDEDETMDAETFSGRTFEPRCHLSSRFSTGLDGWVGEIVIRNLPIHNAEREEGMS